MTLNKKIIILILEVGLIPLMLLGFIGYSNAKQQITQGVFNKLDIIAQIQKNRLQDTLDNKQNLLSLFINQYLLFPNLNKDLVGIQGNGTSIRSIFVVNLTGKVIASTNSAQLGTDVSGESFFQKGIKQNDVSILKKDVTSGIISQFLAGPLVIGGETFGMAVVVTDADDIISIADDYTGLGNTGETLLAKDDGNGNALFLTPTRLDPNAGFIRVVPKEHTNVPTVHAIAGEEGILNNAVDYRGVSVFAVTRYIREAGWGIVVKIDQAEALAPVKKLAALFLFVIFITGCFIIFIGILISRSITNPILKLIGFTNKIAQGDLSQGIIINSKDEVGTLGQAFNIMVSKLKESYVSLEKKVNDRTQDLENEKTATQNVLEDLSLEKSKVENLASNLKKFKMAVDNTSEMVVITDPEGVVVYGNKAVEEITGYKAEEAIGKKSGVLWKTPMSQEYYQKLWDTIENQKKVFIGEIQNKRKNGELYTAAISISPILDKDGKIEFFVSIERDVTKEKEIDQAKTEFVSIASHQLRTPLTAINWYVEMLQSGDAGELNPKQKKYLEEIYKGSVRMVKLVNELLNISRIETGRLKIEPEIVDLVSFVEDIIREIEPWGTALRREIIFKKGEDLPQETAVDKILMRQVVNNMITNAVRYSPESQNINVALEKKAEEYIISVADQGIGIPKEVQGKIFGKFFRADNAREVESEGSGIGMYISKSIAEASGGKLWFESPTALKKVDGKDVGYGTTFHLSIPISGMKAHEGEKGLA